MLMLKRQAFGMWPVWPTYISLFLYAPLTKELKSDLGFCDEIDSVSFLSEDMQTNHKDFSKLFGTRACFVRFRLIKMNVHCLSLLPAT